MNITKTNQVEDLKTYKQDEWKKDLDTQRNEVEETLNEPRYLLSIYEGGDVTFTNGDSEKMVSYKRNYEPNCSMQEVAERIKTIGEPFWRHPMLRDGMSEEEQQSSCPFDERRWGIVENIHINPMTEKLVDYFLYENEKGTFDKYRQFYGTGKVILDRSEIGEVS